MTAKPVETAAAQRPAASLRRDGPVRHRQAAGQLRMRLRTATWPLAALLGVSAARVGVRRQPPSRAGARRQSRRLWPRRVRSAVANRLPCDPGGAARRRPVRRRCDARCGERRAAQCAHRHQWCRPGGNRRRAGNDRARLAARRCCGDRLHGSRRGGADKPTAQQTVAAQPPPPNRRPASHRRPRHRLSRPTASNQTVARRHAAGRAAAQAAQPSPTKPSPGVTPPAAPAAQAAQPPPTKPSPGVTPPAAPAAQAAQPSPAKPSPGVTPPAAPAAQAAQPPPAKPPPGVTPPAAPAAQAAQTPPTKPSPGVTPPAAPAAQAAQPSPTKPSPGVTPPAAPAVQAAQPPANRRWRNSLALRPPRRNWRRPTRHMNRSQWLRHHLTRGRLRPRSRHRRHPWGTRQPSPHPASRPDLWCRVARRLGVAAFRRGSTALIVFDQPITIDIAPLQDDPIFGAASVQTLQTATVIRLPLDPAMALSPSRTRDAWRITAVPLEPTLRPIQAAVVEDRLVLRAAERRAA